VTLVELRPVDRKEKSQNEEERRDPGEKRRKRTNHPLSDLRAGRRGFETNSP